MTKTGPTGGTNHAGRGARMRERRAARPPGRKGDFDQNGPEKGRRIYFRFSFIHSEIGCWCFENYLG